MDEARADHDLLIRIDEKVTLLMTFVASKADAREVAELRQAAHDDRDTVTVLTDRVDRHDRLFWVGAGVVLAVQLILQFFRVGG
jgi:N-acetylmuramic acid 6-phosphate (MurNAc-6-P) etherase